MTSVEKRTVVTTRHEYVLSSPACAADIQIAITMALNDMPEERTRLDDAFTVEALDDEIVISWPEAATSPEGGAT